MTDRAEKDEPGKGGSKKSKPVTLWGHKSDLRDAAYTSDGKRLFSVSDESIMVWEGKNLEAFAKPTVKPLSLAISPDDKWLYIGYTDGTIEQWDASNATKLKTFKEHQSVVYDIDISPDGKLIASASEDRFAKLTSVSDGKVTALNGTKRKAFMAVAFSRTEN